MSEEQRDLTPDERAERDRLVARLTAATDVVRQAKAVMGDANAEIDRLRAELAAERERAEAGASRLRAALLSHGQHIHRCPRLRDDGDEPAVCTCGLDAALATDAGRELLEAAEEIAAALGDEGTIGATRRHAARNAAALARYQAVRGQ